MAILRKASQLPYYVHVENERVPNKVSKKVPKLNILTFKLTNC